MWCVCHIHWFVDTVPIWQCVSFYSRPLQALRMSTWTSGSLWPLHMIRAAASFDRGSGWALVEQNCPSWLAAWSRALWVSHWDPVLFVCLFYLVSLWQWPIETVCLNFCAKFPLWACAYELRLHWGLQVRWNSGKNFKIKHLVYLEQWVFRWGIMTVNWGQDGAMNEFTE